MQKIMVDLDKKQAEGESNSEIIKEEGEKLGLCLWKGSGAYIG